jgi:hypothetical protein
MIRVLAGAYNLMANIKGFGQAIIRVLVLRLGTGIVGVMEPYAHEKSSG